MCTHQTFHEFMEELRINLLNSEKDYPSYQLPSSFKDEWKCMLNTMVFPFEPPYEEQPRNIPVYQTKQVNDRGYSQQENYKPKKELDVKPKHRFSSTHGKALKEVQNGHQSSSET